MKNMEFNFMVDNPYIHHKQASHTVGSFLPTHTCQFFSGYCHHVLLLLLGQSLYHLAPCHPGLPSCEVPTDFNDILQFNFFSTQLTEEATNTSEGLTCLVDREYGSVDI